MKILGVMGRRLARLMAGGLATAAFGYLRICYWTSRFHLTGDFHDSMKRSWDRGVPTVLVCWHDEFIMSLLTIQLDRFRRVLFITNDSFGGVFLETFCRLLGITVQIIRMQSPRRQRIDAMAEGLRAHGALAIAADYGRPWYRARPTAAELARLTDGLVVAIRCEPKRKVLVGWGDRRAYLPLPFNEYALRAGPPRQPVELARDPADGVAGGGLDAELDRLRDSSAFEAPSVTDRA